MPKVKIQVFEGGVPSATISIPTWVVSGASKLIPKVSGKRLDQHVDIAEIAALIKDPEARGTVIEIEDHKGKDRLVISVED